MKIEKYKSTGFSEDKRPTARMLFNLLIQEAFKRKGSGDEITYRKIMSELVPPPDPNDVWGDALDMTEGKPPIPEEKIGKLYITYCVSKQD